MPWCNENFRRNTEQRKIKSHVRPELQDSENDSPELESLQAEVKRHPVNLDHQYKRPLPQRVSAFLSEWVFLIVVLSMVAFAGLMIFGFIKP